VRGIRSGDHHHRSTIVFLYVFGRDWPDVVEWSRDIIHVIDVIILILVIIVGRQRRR
jgi:hypothetical protein